MKKIGSLLILMLLIVGCSNEEVIEVESNKYGLSDADMNYITELNPLLLDIEKGTMELLVYAASSNDPNSPYYKNNDHVKSIHEMLIKHYKTLQEMKPTSNFKDFHKEYMVSVHKLKFATNYLNGDYRKDHADFIMENYRSALDILASTNEDIDKEYPGLLKHYKVE